MSLLRSLTSKYNSLLIPYIKRNVYNSIVYNKILNRIFLNRFNSTNIDSKQNDLNNNLNESINNESNSNNESNKDSNNSNNESTPKKPTTYYSEILVLILGLAGIYWKYESDLDKLSSNSSNSAEIIKTLGKPLVGSPFSLIDTNNKIISDKDFRGKYMLLYFGFTKCPDICPVQMDKMTDILNICDKDGTGKLIQPIFITVDPGRDTSTILKEYRKKFHPNLIALTGPIDTIKKVAKAYRIYINIPENTTEDYLVDHSICYYLMDTNGEILEYFGQHFDKNEVHERLNKCILDDQEELKSGRKVQK